MSRDVLKTVLRAVVLSHGVRGRFARSIRGRSQGCRFLVSITKPARRAYRTLPEVIDAGVSKLDAFAVMHRSGDRARCVNRSRDACCADYSIGTASRKSLRPENFRFRQIRISVTFQPSAKRRISVTLQPFEMGEGEPRKTRPGPNGTPGGKPRISRMGTDKNGITEIREFWNTCRFLSETVPFFIREIREIRGSFFADSVF